MKEIVISFKINWEIESRFINVEKYKLTTGAKSSSNIRLYNKSGYEITGYGKLNDKVDVVYMEKKNGMKNSPITNRDFNSISPSAVSLILMKGLTDIPFARKTAELISLPEKYNPDFSNKDSTFWARLLHFETRYWSINKLLSELPITNILELSSGLSFRGLDTVKQKGIYYIDTDLPDMIETKTIVLKELIKQGACTEGELKLLPLNALDEKQFFETVSNFPDGKITILNEGLLMYLDIDEKEKLCGIIHKVLTERGGYWITGDIYLKNKHNNLGLKFEDKTKDFFGRHNIEDNKFDSFEEAESFFRKMGFIIDKEAIINRSELSTMDYFLKNTPAEQLSRIRKEGKVQATWRLRIAAD